MWFHSPSTIETEGARAVRVGATLSACPYDVGTPEHGEWVNGWIHWHPDNVNSRPAFEQRQAERRAATPERPKLDPDVAALMEPEATTTWRDVTEPRPDPIDEILNPPEPPPHFQGFNGLFGISRSIVMGIPVSQSFLDDLWAAYRQHGLYLNDPSPPAWLPGYPSPSATFRATQGLWSWQDDAEPEPEPDDPLVFPKRPARGKALVRKSSIQGIMHDPWAHQKLVAMKAPPPKPPAWWQGYRLP